MRIYPPVGRQWSFPFGCCQHPCKAPVDTSACPLGVCHAWNCWASGWLHGQPAEDLLGRLLERLHRLHSRRPCAKVPVSARPPYFPGVPYHERGPTGCDAAWFASLMTVMLSVFACACWLFGETSIQVLCTIFFCDKMYTTNLPFLRTIQLP